MTHYTEMYRKARSLKGKAKKAGIPPWVDDFVGWKLDHINHRWRESLDNNRIGAIEDDVWKRQYSCAIAKLSVIIDMLSGFVAQFGKKS